MPKPLVVSIPHRLGKDEALRRIRNGFANASTNFGSILTVEEQTWTGDSLAFRVGALGQHASGTIDVQEDHVRMEVTLPGLLGALAEKIIPAIRRQGTLLLEKK